MKKSRKNFMKESREESLKEFREKLMKEPLENYISERENHWKEILGKVPVEIHKWISGEMNEEIPGENSNVISKGIFRGASEK